ncbi:hypothetical protein JR316_0006460 [Psilocybe cubensis]|uniref:Uncharacterized protein n=2 Tax=Psilocybe cubensis TaxID=181762 RepID=A0ACB8H1P6_PSICU|nr:hypothetical protein JR316_0006460 [Psilocybe cubensis]KAH9481930.1 hypothetical protein JR316_0006460 [Psilocybe cubensis]
MENSVFKFSHLVPTKEILCGFTTCSSEPLPSNVQLISLDDTELGVHKISSSTTHEIVRPPKTDNENKPPTFAWEALYPKNSINPSGPIPGGFGFYLSGPSAFAERLQFAKEAIFSYRMMLQGEWEWVKGGKFPGVTWLTDAQAGGRKSAVTVSIFVRCGGMVPKNSEQATTITPHRAKSIGELYAYLPLTQSNDSQLSRVPPLSIPNADYGFSVGRGAYTFDRAVSRWMSIAFRVKLNDVGENNGEFELWIDGQSVMLADGLSFREREEGKIKGMHFQTFFGGHTKEWATPKDQRAWFSDVTGVIVQ